MAAIALLGISTLASAQQQMLLPYNNPIFQSTWENPAVRPWFRYSIGLPFLSSIEVGAINNGFMLGDVVTDVDGKWVLKPSLVLEELKKHPTSMEYMEFGVDLLHFRMQWRDYFFWLGIRNVTQQSYTMPKELAILALEGNKPLVGETINLNDMHLDLMNYHEFTLGFSKIMENWTFGVRASFLTGQANLQYAANDASLYISDNTDDLYSHTFNMDARLNTSGMPKDEDGYPSPQSLDPAKFKYVNFSNPGFALAGGVAYKPEKNTELTFSFSDVGMIAWGSDLATYQTNETKYKYDGVHGLNRILYERDLNWNLLETSSVRNAFTLNEEKQKRGEAYRTWLSPKFHLMATYNLARATKAGLSFSSTIHQGHFYPSGTMSITQGISDLFFAQAAVSYNQRSFFNVGASLVFNPGPLQFYVVTDNLLGLIKPSIMTATNVRLGMNIVFGPRYKNTLLTHR